MKKWYVYIVECKDKTYYTGITIDLKRRINEHNSKIGAKSIRGKLPVRLVLFENAENQISAAKREREIKSLSHIKKALLVKGLPRLLRVKRGEE